MFTADPDTIEKVEKQLQLNCPSPEGELIQLSKLVANLPDNEIGARVRILTIDIDDLIAQARWSLGQALLLMELYPQIVAAAELSNDPIEQIIAEDEIPSKVLLIIRSYIVAADKVLYSDLSQSRRGGIVAGWIYHMMIDNTIYRVIAALDRLAQILWYAAKLPTRYENGERVKIYFRSKKIARIDSVLQNEYSQKLVDIANNPLLRFAISYRDSFSHNIKVYSKVAGTRPVDEWIESDGKRYVIKFDRWDADTLFGFANATYHQLINALGPAVAICKERFAIETSL